MHTHLLLHRIRLQHRNAFTIGPARRSSSHGTDYCSSPWDADRHGLPFTMGASLLSVPVAGLLWSSSPRPQESFPFGTRHLASTPQERFPTPPMASHHRTDSSVPYLSSSVLGSVLYRRSVLLLQSTPRIFSSSTVGPWTPSWECISVMDFTV